MRNFENQAFRFRQNLQKFYIFVRMASGVQEKVQNLFRWAHQGPGLKMSKFVLENCQICAATNQER
jgi:hypothetical protein